MKTTLWGAWQQRLPQKPLSTARRLIQTGFGLLSLYIGYQFYLFYQWTAGRAESFVARPPGVEGFLPISALVGLKRLLLTGAYDMVHPAGLTIFIAALSMGLLLRKSFCGWICPVGLTSNLAEAAGRRLRLLRRLPGWADYPLLALKYLLLALFLYLIAWQMELAAIEAFHGSAYNVAADAKMLLFFLDLTPLAATVMLLLVVVSFVLRNFWCRYLCPYGALLGLLAMIGPLQVRRDNSKCIGCRRCDKVCPASIEISCRGTVRAAECIGCLECVEACPQQDCLTAMLPGKKKIPAMALPLAVLMLFLLFWGAAKLTGHWESEVPLAVFKKIYAMSGRLPHP